MRNNSLNHVHVVNFTTALWLTVGEQRDSNSGLWKPSHLLNVAQKKQQEEKTLWGENWHEFITTFTQLLFILCWHLMEVQTPHFVTCLLKSFFLASHKTTTRGSGRPAGLKEPKSLVFSVEMLDNKWSKIIKMYFFWSSRTAVSPSVRLPLFLTCCCEHVPFSLPFTPPQQLLPCPWLLKQWKWLDRL